MNEITVFTGPINVHIDVKLPDELLNLDKKMLKRVPAMTRRIALEAKSFWKSEAGRRLRSSRKVYQNAIEHHMIDDTSFYLTLSGYIPYSVEMGGQGFDMKPGFLRNAKPWPPPGKKRFPRAKAETFAPKSITQYRIIPLNVNRYVNMNHATLNQKPTKFRTVHDQSPAGSWKHPGFKGARIADEVAKELDTRIIPKHVAKLFGE